MGYYGYDYYDTIGGYTSSYAPIVYVVVAILAVILGIVLFCTMLRKKNENKYTGSKAKIYHFLNVNKFYTEDIVRLLYVITVCVLTLVGLAQIVMGSFLTGILFLLVGNVAARISYECLLMFFVLVRKTVAIDKRLSNIESFYSDDFDDGVCVSPEECECEILGREACDSSCAEAEASGEASADVCGVCEGCAAQGSCDADGASKDDENAG